MPEQESKKEAKGSKDSASKGSSGSQKSSSKKKELLAAILIRGTVGAEPDTKKTLRDLKLFDKNNCRFMEDTESNRGMLRKAKDFVTFGKVSASIRDELSDRENNGTYRLHPPRGGFERKGIKRPYKNGGALGLRDNMEELLRKMK